MKIFFTSDLHLNHNNIIKYCNRPYETVDLMNEDIVSSWNKVVSDEDVVYALGDIGFGNLSMLSQLKGKKIFLQGNHDGERILKQLRKVTTEPVKRHLEIQIEDYFIDLSHYPPTHIEKNTIYLHGHLHSDCYNPVDKIMDVGVDHAISLLGKPQPFSFSQIKILLGV